MDFSDSDDLLLEPHVAGESYGVVADGHSTVPMLDFRGHNGTSFALPYRQIRSISLHPDEGISLEFTDHKIQVHGRNLRPLYGLLLAHQVTFVQEGDLDVLSESATFVDKIRVTRVGELG